MGVGGSASNSGIQFFAFAILSLAAAATVGILSLRQRALFGPYFGALDPLVAIAIVAVLGFVSLGYLQRRGWFEILDVGVRLRGVALAAALATVYVIPTILADWRGGFTRDINVSLPQSLLFYPAMGYVVEVVFHTLPLALLLFSLGPLFKDPNPSRLVWVCIVLVALLEPIFQAAITPRQASWVGVYVGVHLFAFGLCQLYLFRRFDFATMYAFRLVYYLHWHIVWGYLRLQWLF